MNCTPAGQEGIKEWEEFGKVINGIGFENWKGANF